MVLTDDSSSNGRKPRRRYPGGQLSPTRRKTTWSDLPRDSFRGSSSSGIGLSQPRNAPPPLSTGEPSICAVGRESVEVGHGYGGADGMMPHVDSRWNAPGRAAGRGRSPLRLDNTMLSPRASSRSRSRSRSPRRLPPELGDVSSETSDDSELEYESRRRRRELLSGGGSMRSSSNPRSPSSTSPRRTGGAAGGRWGADSALARVVEQNQPAYLYSL